MLENMTQIATVTDDESDIITGLFNCVNISFMFRGFGKKDYIQDTYERYDLYVLDRDKDKAIKILKENNARLDIHIIAD